MGIENSGADVNISNGQNNKLDEEQLLASISKLRVEINRIESTTGPSNRSVCIRNEIKRLGRLLASCKLQAQNRADQVS